MKKEFTKEPVTKFLSGIVDEFGEVKKERTITEISRNRLLVFHTGEGHPFEVIDDEEMEELAESIKSNGILEPIIIRQDENFEGRYEIIAGHRRVHAAEIAGIDPVPCLVVDYDDDMAIKLMVSSNLERRQNIKPSVKAKAYKMYMEANKRQAGRPKKNQFPGGTDLRENNEFPRGTSYEQAGAAFGEGKTTVHRYLRLNKLIPELLQMVDDETLTLKVGVELSYLDEDEQRTLLGKLEEGYVLKLEEAVNLRNLQKEKILEAVKSMGIKDSPKIAPKVTLNEKFINGYLPEPLRKKSVEQKRRYTQEALIRFNNYLEEHPEEQKIWMEDKTVI